MLSRGSNRCDGIGGDDRNCYFISTANCVAVGTTVEVLFFRLV